ncbi:mannonate dehydratase [Polymorphum gilvum]|uniref:Mannonate dehydratase n=1 Tax=Polymorphum gilvum (strain LMG 25793 / CGMCC 1.9160 / SL003B-26A1) TaxID=991905 RepID=F2IXJ5_POLGS|nr:mannonate dehydratase [Polymorphum gilvum]ADZ71618.1 Mannonate dehydratase [Polymorphum gilvum SL003B-26A1]
MQQTWRWFGPADPVSLADIRQAGATGVVTALHDLPNGTVWPMEAIAARKVEIEAAGLTWSVVESIPVHEDIKTGAPGWERHARAWAETVRNLAACGITRVCYNFMPVIDWTRTELAYELADGARCLRFDHVRYAAFDLFVLGRAGAGADHSPETVAAARVAFEAMTPTDIEALTKTIIAGLPGSEESYSLEGFRQRLSAYEDLDAQALRRNLAAFLTIVVPVAEAAGALLAIHPDDPPRSLFGLPRIVSTIDDMAAIAAMVDSPANGFTLCTGSYGVRADNDIVAMIERFGDRIHFLHLRTTKREADGLSFHEAAHLDGDVDMVAVIRAIHALERRRGCLLPMRPDHGHQILDDLRKSSTPGYPAIGRLRGLAELRGVERAVQALT